MALRLTERDIQMMKWANGHFIVHAHHIATYMNVLRVTAYQRLLKLVHEGYLIHERIFYNAPGIYRVTHKGVVISGDDLPAIHKVNLQNYHHDLTVAGLSLDLLQKHKGSTFIPERRLRREQGLHNFNRSDHVADGVLEVNGESIAIEVELTAKSEKRLHNILHYYLKHPEYKRVWYFCGSDEVKTKVDHLSKNFPFVETFYLGDALC